MPNLLRIISQPKCQYASMGAKVELMVEASGMDLTFQWYNQGGLAMPGANTHILALGPLKKEHFGFYRVRVRDSCGSYLLSDWAELADVSYVSPPCPMFVIEPKAVTARVGECEYLFSHATGVNLQYQWYNEKGVLIPGASNKYLLFTPIKENDFGFYRCAVLDMFGGEAFSNWIQVLDEGAVMSDIC